MGVVGYGWTARIAHGLAGFLAGFLTIFDFKLTILFTVLFLVYEIWETIRIKDTGYLELREFIIGLYIGVMFWVGIWMYVMHEHLACGVLRIRVNLWR